jgi:hypothetical protein
MHVKALEQNLEFASQCANELLQVGFSEILSGDSRDRMPDGGRTFYARRTLSHTDSRMRLLLRLPETHPISHRFTDAFAFAFA